MIPLEIVYTTPLASWNPHKIKDFGNNAQLVEASGVRTILPSITGGVGEVRTRYPIAPVHWRGSAVWKELSAYEDSLSQ
ncbi:hypothetical protein ElyMa_005196600 [Elysia marginata]|uniref:Uncharacterized protein n=1 Tax=Elysia marginata TaxID=1093978 RepID=A0AAV4JT19_9GAST|nr:hypothetical protein ElyMa_005196600 [Elysia marginata]